MGPSGEFLDRAGPPTRGPAMDARVGTQSCTSTFTRTPGAPGVIKNTPMALGVIKNTPLALRVMKNYPRGPGDY